MGWRGRRSRGSRWRAGSVGLALALVAVLGACGSLSSPSRQEAKAEVSADRTDVPVQIVTSTMFNVDAGGQDPTQPPSSAPVSLLQSDTTVQNLPYSGTFDIRATGRFFIRAQIPEAATDTPSVSVHITVLVDGEQRNSVAGDLADGPVQAVFLSAGSG
ncbi:MAG TPA: hypothetical protein VKB18_00900 [Gemmatimonadota bacterium]|nr:hypothetical protein [Gemmatimonadota bacterium]